QTYLPYPEGKQTGEQIAQQAFAVSHGKFVSTFISKKHNKDIAKVVNRTSLEKRKSGRKPTVNTFEIYTKNTPDDASTESMQMAFITSGKIKGMGILNESFKDKSKAGMLSFWLPALRRIRQVNEPAHEDTWIGSNLTYGELILRRPEHEDHELIGEEVFKDCLLAMQLSPKEINRFTRNLPKSQCGHKGKEVYIIKSTTKFESWWYDYHITEIDKKTFAPYRTVYYKNDKKIKTVNTDWQSLGEADPRITYQRYIYAITHSTGVDSMVFIPGNTVSINEDKPNSFWSIKTLKKRGR
ncbi:MAG: outer membrane lipoprotein-sorting protein, partial [Gammaproteobacteria bacterium]|nr:outer membrane lipoprotein-sorting protein [Gammaproteobacteria bacterium]